MLVVDPEAELLVHGPFFSTQSSGVALHPLSNPREPSGTSSLKCYREFGSSENPAFLLNNKYRVFSELGMATLLHTLAYSARGVMVGYIVLVIRPSRSNPLTESVSIRCDMPSIPLKWVRNSAQTTASVPIENCLIPGVQSENLGLTWVQLLPK
jgi:hypothetical protein